MSRDDGLPELLTFSEVDRLLDEQVRPPAGVTMTYLQPVDADEFSARLAKAASPSPGGGPVGEAMRRWLEGVPVPSFDEFLGTYGTEFRNYRYAWDLPFDFTEGRMLREMTNLGHRWGFVEAFGFSLPCSEALDVLEQHAPILEVGAGSGYWSALMARRGIDVAATDAGFEKFHFEVARYFPVVALQGKTAVRRYPDRNVFCSWPSLNETWLRQAARAMRPGRTLIVVREDATADERTWDYIERAFRHVGDCELPCWYGMHDHLEIWKKRARPVDSEADRDEEP